MENSKVPKILYKYTTVEIAKIILENSTIRFNSPLNFNDPYDTDPPFSLTNDYTLDDKYYKKEFDDILLYCSPPQRKLLYDYAESENFEKITAKQKIKEDILSMAKRMGVLCLSSRKDSILMWSHYSKNHTGIVFGVNTNYNFLKYVTPIKYKKNPPEIKGVILKDFSLASDRAKKELNKILLTKYIDWKYEQEYRCAIDIPRKEGNETFELFLNGPKEPLFYDYPFDKSFIQKIYFGVNTSKDDKNEIYKIVHEKNYSKIKFYQAIKSDCSYKLKFEQIK